MQRAVGKNDKVLRQITAGVNAGLTVTHLTTGLPDDYECLKDVPFIEQVVIHPPFITYSKRNKRDGVFPESRTNPVTDLTFNPDQWLCYPARLVSYYVSFTSILSLWHRVLLYVTYLN